MHHQCNIKRWCPQECKPHRIYLIVGRRGSGKSVLLRELLCQVKGSVDYAMAFCPTMESRQMLLEHLPPACVFDRLIQSKVEDLVALAAQLAAKGKKRKFLLILDDVLYDKSAFRTKAIRELFFNGRHYCIQCIILSQFIMDIEPSLRANVDYCICFKDNNISNKMRLWKYMFGLLSSLDDFIAVMDRCTQNFECMVLDNTGSSSAISDSLFWYKARLELEAFKVGSPVFFKLSKLMRRPENAPLPMTSSSYDAGGGGGGGRRSRLQVVKEDEGGPKPPGGDDASGQGRSKDGAEVR